MLEVYLILGILGLLYAKSNKTEEKFLDYVNVNYEVEKEKEAEEVTEKKNVFPIKELKTEPKIYGLTGEEINTEKFLTRDNGAAIQAYTTKGVKDFGDNKDVRYLETFTGREKFLTKKTETKPFFKHMQDRNNNLNFIEGSMKDQAQTRGNTSQMRKGEIPFEQVHVGSGINLEKEEDPRGGFHQFEINEIMRPKNVDQLRSKSNQKLTYRGRVLKGKNSVDQRTFESQLFKNRTSKTFNLGDPGKTAGVSGGVQTRKTLRPDFKATMPLTNRMQSREFVGSLKGPEGFTKQAKLRAIRKNLFRGPKVNNKYNPNSWDAKNKMSDYGKSGIIQYPNERDVTQKRTYKSNLVTTVKSLIAPLLDKAKETRKQRVEVNLNPSGYLKPNRPNKLTSYDPNDIAKTTIKETLIHDSRKGNLKGNERYTGYTYKDLPKITIKQTSEVNKHYLGPSAENGDAYRFIKVDMRATNKQFTSDHEYHGIVGGKDKAMTSQQSAKNARLNLDKGKKGRYFTPSGPKDAISGKDLTVVIKKQMSGIKSKPPIEGLKEIATATETLPNILVKQNEVGIEYNQDKLDPSLLEAFTKNPYTQPLDSYSYGVKINGVQKQAPKPEPEPEEEGGMDDFDKLLDELTYD